MSGSTLAGPITTTSYTYDLSDRMTGIAPASGDAVTFTIDALGRHKTKSVVGVLSDTYAYAGSSEAIVQIARPAGNIDSALDALNNRAATKTSLGFGWLLPDLHGDVAAAFDSTGATVTDAFRYDAYGETINSTKSALPSPWRYQGRLLLNDDANSDLYDFVFRSYDPGLGTFLSLDDAKGSAQNPITFNRFLYASANPDTLIDPDGHCTTTDSGGGFDFLGSIGNCLAAGAGLVVGTGESVVGVGSSLVGAVGSVPGAVASVPGHAADIARCGADQACRDQTSSGLLMSAAGLAGQIHAGGQGFLANPGAAIRGAGSSLSFAAADWIGREHELLTTKGGFEGGREAGHILGTTEAVGLTAIYGAKALPGTARALPAFAGEMAAGTANATRALLGLPGALRAAASVLSDVPRVTSALRTTFDVAKQTVDVLRTQGLGAAGKWLRFGATSNMLPTGEYQDYAWAIKFGSAKEKFPLPFGGHITRDNWWRPWEWAHINRWPGKGQ
jgi:RHS repeat-associated protein